MKDSEFLRKGELKEILDTIFKKTEPLPKNLGLNEQGKPKYILPIMRKND